MLSSPSTAWLRMPGYSFTVSFEVPGMASAGTRTVWLGRRLGAHAVRAGEGDLLAVREDAHLFLDRVGHLAAQGGHLERMAAELTDANSKVDHADIIGADRRSASIGSSSSSNQPARSSSRRTVWLPGR